LVLGGAGRNAPCVDHEVEWPEALANSQNAGAVSAVCEIVQARILRQHAREGSGKALWSKRVNEAAWMEQVASKWVVEVREIPGMPLASGQSARADSIRN
jgi:hypothetical protein